ncbi:hypothetical protein CB1_000507005 [Camelus ferus]|nr:hypothetical protein CB1_000507005 [Camelus ferus]
MQEVQEVQAVQAVQKLQEEVQELQAVQEVQELQAVQEVQELQAVQEVQELQAVQEVQELQAVQEVQELQAVQEVQELQEMQEVQEVQAVQAVQGLQEVQAVQEVQELQAVQELQENRELGLSRQRAGAQAQVLGGSSEAGERVFQLGAGGGGAPLPRPLTPPTLGPAGCCGVLGSALGAPGTSSTCPCRDIDLSPGGTLTTACSLACSQPESVRHVTRVFHKAGKDTLKHSFSGFSRNECPLTSLVPS